MALTGIDISKWQQGLNPASIACDIVIAKATEGIGYTDRTCAGFIQKAKAAGKLTGVYHFARPDLGNSGAAEADWFLHEVSGFVGSSVLILDWEAGNLGDVAWAKAWLDRVHQRTGVRPLIYMSASPAGAHDWSRVSRDYGLWIAGYPNSRPGGLSTPSCPYRPGHGWTIAMWQYTSSGTTRGYAGRLDMNVFYGDREAWARFAATSGNVTPAPTPKPTTPTQKPDIRGIQRAVRVAADNVVGPQTRGAVNLLAKASRWGGGRFPQGVIATQAVVGTTRDGIWGPHSIASHDATVAAVQRALRALGYPIAVDAIWGPKTNSACMDVLNLAHQA